MCLLFAYPHLSKISSQTFWNKSSDPGVSFICLQTWIYGNNHNCVCMHFLMSFFCCFASSSQFISRTNGFFLVLKYTQTKLLTKRIKQDCSKTVSFSASLIQIDLQTVIARFLSLLPQTKYNFLFFQSVLVHSGQFWSIQDASGPFQSLPIISMTFTQQHN